MSSTISENSTHDLWVEARQFDITLTRPTPTTIQLTITRPTGLEVTDGALVTAFAIAAVKIWSERL